MTSAGATNNKIPDISKKYNNFSLTSKGMRVWQAYNVGEGRDIERSWNVKMSLDLKGLGIGRKRYCMLHKEMQTKGKHNVIESVDTFSCFEPA